MEMASPDVGPGPHLLMIWISRHQRSLFFGLSSCRHCLMAICSPVAYREGTPDIRTINNQTYDHHRTPLATQVTCRTPGHLVCPTVCLSALFTTPHHSLPIFLLHLPIEGAQSLQILLSLPPSTKPPVAHPCLGLLLFPAYANCCHGDAMLNHTAQLVIGLLHI